MIEIFIICSFIFLIYVFFYKQVNNEYSINQVTSLEKVNDLLYDKSPIVVKDIQIPTCVLPQTLLKTQRFQTMLGSYLEKRENTLPYSYDFDTFIANETGFQVAGEHMWFPILQTNMLANYISTLKSRISFGSKPFIINNAIYTILIPIEGKYTCSLINNENGKMLPSDLTNIYSIDSLQKNIQYIDILLKPGNILIIPAHWYYSMKEDAPYSYYGIYEYHEPISLLQNYIDSNKQ